MKRRITLFFYVAITVATSTEIFSKELLPPPLQKENAIMSSTDGDDYGIKSAPKVAAVSPNAASLGIFGAIPVGFYTGVPDISIPLYELKLENKTIPIKLSYHASGIRVSQEASSVGLGWALNAGGSIVREMRGLDDFLTSTPKGYYYDTTFAHWNSNNDLDQKYFDQDLPQYRSYLNGELDSEPDLFHFNFLSFAGTMFFDKINMYGNSSTSAKGIVLKENNYLDISIDPSPSKLNVLIYDGDGFKYYFTPHESSATYTVTLSDYNSTIPKNYFPQNSAHSEYTAWYLDSIVSPNHNRISFKYDSETIVTPISVVEDVSYAIGGRVGKDLQRVYKYYNYSYSKCTQSKLKKIIFDGGYIYFDYSDRIDLESSNGEKAQKLESMTVYNIQNKVVKSIAFQHSYIGDTNTSSKCRLMLDAVELDSNTEKPFSYILSYNRGELPDKNSPSCDDWGYYNASTPPKDEISFKLSPEIYIKDGSTITHYSGIDKNANTNSFNGILESIQYPTGGKTSFDYELHQYVNPIGEVVYKQKTIFDFYSLKLCSPSYCVSTKSFEIKEPTIVNLETYFYPLKPDPGYPYPSIYVYIYKLDPSGQRIEFKDFYYETNASSHFDNTGSNIYKQTLEFPAGTYYFDIRNNHQGWKESTVRISANAIIKEIETLGKGAGLRVKTITNYTKDNKLNKREFVYTGGLLMAPPWHFIQYALKENVYTINPGGAVFTDAYSALYLNGSSIPYTPFSYSAQGGHVGYSCVEENIVDSTNGQTGFGKTSYKYSNNRDDSSNISDRLIKGFPSVSHQDNGNIMEICYFDNNMQLNKKKTFEYLYNRNTYIVKGLKVFQMPIAKDITKDMSTIKYYDLYSERWQLARTTELDYNENREAPVKTTTEYGYNNANLLANYEKKIDSKNNIIEKQIKYSIDSTSSINEKMKEYHMVNIPTEIITNITSTERKKEINRIHNQYIQDIEKTKNLISLGKIESSKSGISDLRTDVIFERYDLKGNIVHYMTINGENIIHLWGYNGLYPVAEIKNAKYEEVQSAVKKIFPVSDIESFYLLPMNQEYEARLRNGDLQKEMPNSQVTTYTYEPLVGMKSMTTPNGEVTTYEYDSSGRLITIRDNNLKQTSSYDYNYNTAMLVKLAGNLSTSSSYPMGTTQVFTVSANGGSGKYQYSWTLKNSSGSLLYDNSNSTASSISVTLNQQGTMILTCIVTDSRTGEQITCTSTFTVLAAPIEFTDITETKKESLGNYTMQGYINCTVPVSIDFGLECETLGECTISIGGTSYSFSRDAEQKITKTLPAGSTLVRIDKMHSVGIFSVNLCITSAGNYTIGANSCLSIWEYNGHPPVVSDGIVVPKSDSNVSE